MVHSGDPVDHAVLALLYLKAAVVDRLAYTPDDVAIVIFGLPGETLTSFKRSLNYASSLDPDFLAVFPLMILPGTELRVRRPARPDYRAGRSDHLQSAVRGGRRRGSI